MALISRTLARSLPMQTRMCSRNPHCVGQARTFHAVAKDVLLFKDDRNSFYRTLSFGASLMGVAAIYNGLTFYKGSAAMGRRFDRAKSTMEFQDTGWWSRYKAALYRMVSGDRIRYGVTIFMCGFGVVCMLGAYVIPIRCVHRMSLLQGGHRVSITTFGPFGINKKHDIRVDDITAVVTRQSYYGSIPINVKGMYPGFRLDNKNGKFLNTELFDDVVSVQKIFRK